MLTKVWFIIHFLLFLNYLSCSQSTETSKNSIQSFIPDNWILIDSVNCDFNNDNLIDVAFVVQDNKPQIQKNNECGGDENYYKKALIIAFKSKGGSLELMKKTDKIFGKCNWGLQGSDAFSDLSKRNNTLKLEFFTGGTLRIVPTYYFAFRKNKWVLIGYTQEKIEVPSNDTFGEDYNLIKGTKEEYKVANAKKIITSTTKFLPKPLLELADVDATGGGVNGITY